MKDKKPRKKKKKIKSYYLTQVEKKFTRVKDKRKVINHIGVAKEIISRMGVYVKNDRRKYLGLKVTNSPVTHKCGKCGKCCDSGITEYGINIHVTDLIKWLNGEFGFPLVSLSLSMTRKTREIFMFLDRKVDYINKARFHSEMYKTMMEIMNPSLKEIFEEHGNHCVFFNSINNKCTIYKIRPISCKIYPYVIGRDKDGKLSLQANENESICDKDCFKQKPLDDEQFEEKVVDLVDIISNRSGFETFFKSKLKGDRAQKAFLYEFFITTFYYLYNEFADIIELNREMFPGGIK